MLDSKTAIAIDVSHHRRAAEAAIYAMLRSQPWDTPEYDVSASCTDEVGEILRRLRELENKIRGIA